MNFISSIFDDYLEGIERSEKKGMDHIKLTIIFAL